jgi:hypothetical protein
MNKAIFIISLICINLITGCSMKYETNYYENGKKVKSETKEVPIFKKKIKDEK